MNLQNLQLRVARKRVEVGVVVQNRRPRAYGSGGNEAVYQLPDGLSLPTATAIECGGIVVVRRPCG